MATTTVVQTMGGGAMRNWSTGLFDCFNDITVCLLGCFCPVCLLFQTASQLGENGCCVACCIPWPYGQMMLRVKIRSENNIQGSICDDYCTVGCCQACAMCQEAREVKYIQMNQGGGQSTLTVVTTQPQMQPVAVQPAVMQPAQPMMAQPGYA
eukprot:scpid63746/ scgid18886/ PLAC8-like protein 1